MSTESGPVASASVPAATSPAPAPGERSGTATGPSAPASEAVAQAPAPGERVCTCAHDGWYDYRCACCNRRPGQPVVAVFARMRERADRAEAKLAAVTDACRSIPSPIAERILAIIDTEPEPLSAVCTGPDCGEQFADSETGEYLFATRERMERLLYADGWAASPVLCPACQPDAGTEPS